MITRGAKGIDLGEVALKAMFLHCVLENSFCHWRTTDVTKTYEANSDLVIWHLGVDDVDAFDCDESTPNFEGQQ
jgi:hypothetical protein